MPRPVAISETPMPEFDPVSADSQKFLEQVKKGKPRNFALITKGVKVLALLVKKKPIKATEAKELKKSSKGQKIFIGVECQIPAVVVGIVL